MDVIEREMSEIQANISSDSQGSDDYNLVETPSDLTASTIAKE